MLEQRWAQFCAMGTIIRFHTNNCCDHRPWTWGTEAEAAIRKILKLRYTLMPTLIAAGRRATADGTPVVQRLDLTWPELAAEGASRNDQYLFADGGMLVAPIIPFNGSDAVAKNPTNGTGNSSRTVWIPPGSWQDAWANGNNASNAVVVGPQMIVVKDCPLDRIPMWHKKGSVLITSTAALSTKEQNWEELAIEIFPFPLEQTNSMGLQMLRSYTAHLHDTKGEQEQHPSRTDVRLDQHASSGLISVYIGADVKHRMWKLRVHLLPGERLSHSGITLDGESIPHIRNKRAQHIATSSDAESHALIAPTIVHDTLAADTQEHHLHQGSVVEAVVRGSQYEQTIHFEVIV
jgi:hypothetical protein